MSQHLEIGVLGEKIATEYLEKKGWRILDRNYKTKLGEIDIISKKMGILVFTEVKTLRKGGFLRPEDNFHKRKQHRFLKSAKIYLLEKRIENARWQIDLIAIDLDRNDNTSEIRHYEKVIGDDNG